MGAVVSVGRALVAESMWPIVSIGHKRPLPQDLAMEGQQPPRKRVRREGAFPVRLLQRLASAMIDAISVPLEKLDVDGVFQFALRHTQNADAAQILKSKGIRGKRLLKMTEKSLLSLGMDVGPTLTLLNAVLEHRPGPKSVVGDEYEGVFVNREKEVASIFTTNVKTNWVAGKGELQLMSVPVCAQLYGAGKTVLGKEYTKQLLKPATRSVIEKELQEMEKEHTGIEGYGLEQLETIAETAVRIWMAIPRIGTSMDPFFQHLAARLSASLGRTASAPDKQALCAELLGETRRVAPVVLILDEIGALGSYDNFARLRYWLAMQLVNNNDQKPLHVILCGRTQYSLHCALDARGITSTVKNKMITMEPLEPSHVEEMASHPHHAKCGQLPASACAHIAHITGGVPRLIRLILEELGRQLESEKIARPVSAEDIDAIAMLIVTDRSNRGYFIGLDAPALAQFARFAALEALGHVLQSGGPDHLLAATQPVLLPRAKEGSDDRKVQCCRMYFELYGKEIEQLEVSAIDMSGLQLLEQGKGAMRENEVLRHLQRQLLKSLLGLGDGNVMARAAGAPVMTTLKDWLGILFGAEDAESEPHLARALFAARRVDDVGDCANEEAEGDGDEEDRLAEGEGGDWEGGEGCMQAEMPAYFQQFRLQGRDKSVGKKGAGETPLTVWKRIEHQVEELKLRQDAAVVLVPLDESHSPDIFVRLPPSCAIRLVSIQVKSRLQTSNGVSVGAIKNDCLLQLPKNVPGKQLHLLLADKVSRKLQELIGKRFLVIKGEEGDGPGWVSSPLLSDEKWVRRNKATTELLLEVARELPDGAVIAVMHPRTFLEAIPKKKARA